MRTIGFRSWSLALAAAIGAMVLGNAVHASPASDASSLRRDVLHRVERRGAPAMARDPRAAMVAAPRLGASGFDVLHYDIQLTPNLALQTLSGTTTITLESTMDGLTTVGLHLHALSVSSVMIGTTPLSFTHVGEALTITLDRPYAPGEQLTARIVYAGTPEHESFGGFFFFSDMAFSMGVGLSTLPPSMGRYWFPCFDEPHDKATVKTRVTVPTGRKVVSNGLLTGVASGPGVVTYTWEETHPTPTYLIAVAIGDWRTVADPVDPARIYHYVLPGDSVKAVTSFQNVSEMMEAFETRYSPFHYDKLSYVGVRRGDMEHSTCVAHLRTLIDGTNFYDPILAHELAHHWWGDWVTVADWRDVWLSEGFATYSEAIYAEHLGGTGAYHAYVNDDLMDYYLGSGETFSIYDPEFFWGATVYEKGGSVLHMLRHVVGDTTFFDILRAWGESFGYSNAVTTDFVAVAEAEAGFELDWFFDEWVFGEGYPVYEWSWTAVPSGEETLVEVDVEQVQSVGAVFSMPIDVRITMAGGDTTVTGVVDEASDTMSFLVSEPPIDVAFDPDRWVLCEKTEVTVGVESPESGGASAPLALGIATPNPLSPSTVMRLAGVVPTLPVDVRVFDAAGRSVRTLRRGSAGATVELIVWDGKSDDGRALPDGLYFLRVRQGTNAITKRLVLLR